MIEKSEYKSKYVFQERGVTKSFKAKLDKLSLSGEAIPLGSGEVKC